MIRKQGRILNWEGTVVLEKNLSSTKRLVVNQGGTRSSKTYSITQRFILKALNETGRTYTIARKTLPALKMTAMRDFFEILNKHQLYNERKHNKTENTYELNQNLFEFISMDQPQKKRGAKRTDLWLNEVNEFDYEDYVQLNLRTERQVFMDYNPSDPYHWVYDKVLNREDAELIVSTYLDNLRFLDKEIIKEIELLKVNDPTYWTIYGRGEKAVVRNIIYSNWKLGDFPEHVDFSIYGLDFGFHDPTALVEIGVKDEQVYWRERLYERGWGNNRLMQFLRDSGIKRYDAIYADSAEPARINEIYEAGFNIHASNKEVFDGIEYTCRHPIIIDKNSVNLKYEIDRYKWMEDMNGKALPQPVKLFDHLLNAARYAEYTHGRLIGQEIFGTNRKRITNKPSGNRERRQRSTFADNY